MMKKEYELQKKDMTSLTASLHLKKFVQICWPLSFKKTQAALLGILAMGFFFFDTGSHRNIFYAFLVISAFNFRLPNLNDVLLKLILAFIGLHFVSLIWSTNSDPEAYWRAFKVAPLIFLALLACQTIKLEKFIVCYVYAATATALILIISNYSEILDQYVIGVQGIWRLEAYGRGVNANIAAVLYGVAGLIFIYNKLPLRWICLALVMCVLLLTLSRGAILAFVLTVACVSMLSNRRLLYALLPLLCVPYIFPNVFRYMIERGTTGRSEIWHQALAYFMQSPILGHGAANALQYKVVEQGRVYNHTHNTYLATLNDTGLIGLIILSSIILCMLARSYSTNNLALFSVVLFGCFFGLFDFGGMYTSLGAEWVVFWFPAFYLLSKEKMPIFSNQGDSKEVYTI